LAECLLPRQKTNTETAHAECHVDYNRPQVAASAPGSLGSMVLYSLSAVVAQWRKCCGGNAKYALPRYPLFNKIFCVRRKPRCGRRPRSTTR
jgi:hypothetical protein